jgi:hypothetical protein
MTAYLEATRLPMYELDGKRVLQGQRREKERVQGYRPHTTARST